MDEKKILIIDDNLDFAEAIKTILNSAKYNVRIATSSDETMKKLADELPDVIILDILMQKGAEGILLSRKFKKDPKLNKIPIIVLTSITKQTGFKFIEDDPRDAKFLPVELFVEKPIPPDELLKKIEALLSQKKVKEFKRIFIVDNDIKFQEELSLEFTERGYEVETNNRLTDVLQRMKDVKFGCVIINVNLPEIKGYEAVPIIKTIDPKIKVIVTADENTKELEAKVREQDVFYYHIKSFGHDELKLAVYDAIK